MRRDIWDDGRGDGAGALVWPAVVALAILVGIVVGQTSVALGVASGVAVVVLAFWRVYKKG